HETGGSALGMELFDQISKAEGSKYDPLEIPKKWRSFDTSGGLRIAKLIDDTGSRDLARAAGGREAFRNHLAEEYTPGVIESDPMTAVAERERNANILLEAGVQWNPDKAWFWGTGLNVNTAIRVQTPHGHRYGYDSFKSAIMFQNWDDPESDGWAALDDPEVHKTRARLWAAGFDPDLVLQKVREAIFAAAHERVF